MEKWLPVKNYEDRYLVSNKGNILSLMFRNKKRIVPKKLKVGHIIKGYFGLVLTKNGIKSDNRVDNLEWCTDDENKKHVFDNGLSEKKIKRKDIPVILDMRQKGYTLKDIAIKFNVTGRNIGAICQRKTWKIY